MTTLKPEDYTIIDPPVSAGTVSESGSYHTAQPTSSNEAYIHTDPEDWNAPGFANAQRAVPSRSPLARLALIGVGILLILIGIPMLILPGPGLAAIAGGAACVAAGVSFRRPARGTSTRKSS